VINSEHLHLVTDTSIHSEYYGSDHCPVRVALDLRRELEDALSLEELAAAID